MLPDCPLAGPLHQFAYRNGFKEVLDRGDRRYQWTLISYYFCAKCLHVECRTQEAEGTHDQTPAWFLPEP
jgi:hypothetical protein